MAVIFHQIDPQMTGNHATSLTCLSSSAAMILESGEKKVKLHRDKCTTKPEGEGTELNSEHSTKSDHTSPLLLVLSWPVHCTPGECVHCTGCGFLILFSEKC